MSKATQGFFVAVVALVLAGAVCGLGVDLVHIVATDNPSAVVASLDAPQRQYNDQFGIGAIFGVLVVISLLAVVLNTLFNRAKRRIGTENNNG